MGALILTLVLGCSSPNCTAPVCDSPVVVTQRVFSPVRRVFVERVRIRPVRRVFIERVRIRPVRIFRYRH